MQYLWHEKICNIYILFYKSLKFIIFLKLFIWIIFHFYDKNDQFMAKIRRIFGKKMRAYFKFCYKYSSDKSDQILTFKTFVR
ncbi:hypothetical protein B0681_04500 [Moraxella porci DSM 25326]|uniref:Uncharacterized protein n=1 Tax=Moraxella porci DSM 25326 TaxID=573983 RepID=A0A1T0CSG3_9GAMM|nr:hypothetical protein B0681_04500 [Moraxella porci DSM 25326]